MSWKKEIGERDERIKTLEQYWEAYPEVHAFLQSLPDDVIERASLATLKNFRKTEMDVKSRDWYPLVAALFTKRDGQMVPIHVYDMLFGEAMLRSVKVEGRYDLFNRRSDKSSQ